MPELIEEQKVGAFLQEKLCNFVAWVSKEVPCEELPPGYLLNKSASQWQCVAFAASIAAMRVPVAGRDFDALAQHEEATPMMVAVLRAVQTRPHLHERFWRYMDMCVLVLEA